MIGDYNQEDGVLKLIPQVWTVRRGESSVNITMDNIQQILLDNIKEVDDKLMVAGQAVMTDSFVNKVELNKENKLVVDLNDKKSMEVDLSEFDTEAIDTSNIDKLFE